ncbi:RNA 2'-phosphotransferase [Streptomyces sp. SID3343]|uniref:RNA 2'-phosphotransferase n=1 Tax=Streptomyces sp. SID3343 TaxID=2690260 RepID=UPI00136A8090|nr:RNA 2'-phosphotransferase [Streptomyces sp. SID3343]MYW04455.1 RNA 2'-phosphotransferase [Streptomyces sp. SID3343]
MDIVKTSKYLSRALRHQPERLGITLDDAGWVDVDALLAACNARNFRLTRGQLDRVVAENDKRRFAFSADGTRIRASQGHTVAVDLGLVVQAPPAVLYHGTNVKAEAAILVEGLRPMSRHDVHLSVDVETARRVGGRRGRPVVFVVHAGRMADDGHRFRRSDNGVWLVPAVPPTYLERPA